MSAKHKRRRGSPGAERTSSESENEYENDSRDGSGGEREASREVSADELFGEHPSSRRRSSMHKDEQLCEQVFQVLAYAMADLADEVLRSVAVESVTMSPEGGRLLLTVISDDARPAAVEELMARLERSRGRLRSEIASGIHRKRTPELGFRVMTRAELREPSEVGEVSEVSDENDGHEVQP